MEPEGRGGEGELGGFYTGGRGSWEGFLYRGVGELGGFHTGGVGGLSPGKILHAEPLLLVGSGEMLPKKMKILYSTVASGGFLIRP